MLPPRSVALPSTHLRSTVLSFSTSSCSSSTLIIGAAGAVGKRLCAALAQRGHRVIASDRTEHLSGTVKRAVGTHGACVGGVDVTDGDKLKQLFKEHADENTTVWNLASPLSVETALDPAVAEAITVGGMAKVLEAMTTVGARKICFTDSIGSFGGSAPRTGAPARWLCEHPAQDPGSDYGRQKRGCRELMAAFARDHGGDPRFAVLPGVLHSNPVWGNGTTEYALDALLNAPHQATRLGLPTGDAYVCPIPPETRLPMVFVDDLMRGLVALQEAEEGALEEPEHGYCIPGLSFSPNELFAEIRKHHPGFGYRVELDENMTKFAQLWPDDLSTLEAHKDLQYAPQVTLSTMVEQVLRAHDERNMAAAEAFKAVGADDGTNMLTKDAIETYVRKHLVEGREDYQVSGQDKVEVLVGELMQQLDQGKQGVVSWKDFSEWNRSNSITNVVISAKKEVEVEALRRQVSMMEAEIKELRATP